MTPFAPNRFQWFKDRYDLHHVDVRSIRPLRSDNPAEARTCERLRAGFKGGYLEWPSTKVTFYRVANYYLAVFVGVAFRFLREPQDLIRWPWSKHAILTLCVTAGLVGTTTSSRRLAALMMVDEDPSPRTVTQAIRLDPGRPEWFLFLAQDWISKGRCDKAEPLLEQATRLTASPTVSAWIAACK